MSSSEARVNLHAAGAIRALASAVDAGCAVTESDLTALVTAAVKLYAAAVERDGAEPPPVTRSVATTEAMVLACALVRSQDLNPFDLALWFAHTDSKAPQKGDPA